MHMVIPFSHTITSQFSTWISSDSLDNSYEIYMYYCTRAYGLYNNTYQRTVLYHFNQSIYITIVGTIFEQFPGSLVQDSPCIHNLHHLSGLQQQTCSIPLTYWAFDFYVFPAFSSQIFDNSLWFFAVLISKFGNFTSYHFVVVICYKTLTISHNFSGSISLWVFIYPYILKVILTNLYQNYPDSTLESTLERM